MRIADKLRYTGPYAKIDSIRSSNNLSCNVRAVQRARAAATTSPSTPAVR